MKRVLLGMSGGVDSSVSAILLKNQGYEVIGATMKLWCGANKQEKEKNEKSIQDAKKVCEKLGIEHYIFDAQKEFEKYVINDFVEQYKNAKTPNPCIECNKKIKFGYFFDKAQELKCDYVATGHYARIEYSEKYNQYVLRKSSEEKKDQSYFLYTIPKEKLDKIIFPLQDFTSKEEIRKIAQENNLEVAEKKDSQEICFIPDNCYQNFLESRMNKPKEGNIILRNGEILGKHKGLINYTIGQRKGIGISYKEPLYVIELNQENNEVIVGTESELYSKKLFANSINWQVDISKIANNNENKSTEPSYIECFAKIRYRAKEAEAIVRIKENKLQCKDNTKNNDKIDANNKNKKKNDTDETIEIEFKEPQRAITKGQSVVFYDKDDIVLGGGKIL